MHMAELLNSSKRVREEKKELPEDPVLATWSPRGEEPHAGKATYGLQEGHPVG